MNSPETILTLLSMVAYCAVAVILWRVATQPFVGVRVRLALRFTAGLLLFVLFVFLWTAANSYAAGVIAFIPEVLGNVNVND